MLCEIQANQSNYSTIKISQSIILKKAHVIEIAKACAVVFMKARNSLVVQHVTRKKKKTGGGENLFFRRAN